MKSVLKLALALVIFAGSLAQVSAATTTGAPKVKITKRSLHDGCHSRYAQMRGRPCR